MRCGLDALGHCDDSDGMLGGILSDIADVHWQATARGAYPPGELARRLLDLQLSDDFGLLGIESYLPALRPEGLAEYRKLAAEKWKKIAPLTPGARADRYAGHRSQLTAIMTGLARFDGDVDALIEVLARDLSEPHCYVNIVQTYSGAKRYDEALIRSSSEVRKVPAAGRAGGKRPSLG